MNDNDLETRDARYLQQTKEQFEELGRFVQQFEQMINTVRHSIVRHVRHPNQTIMNIILHHRVMTAQPLFDILRAILFENLKHSNLEVAEKEIINEIFVQIANDYNDCVKDRNILLHGTWYIGWANPLDTDFSQFHVYKPKVTSTGIQNSETPKNVNELRDLTVKCSQTRGMIDGLCFILADGLEAKKNFKKNGKRWEPLFTYSP